MYIYYKLKIMARPRKYTLNENYFEEIDSSNKSYILGFIYADGSINKKNNSLTICLSEKDKDVLKFIKKMNLAPADFKTQRVSLNPQYDYEKKKHSYNATQTIEILLRDLSNYDELMEGLVNQGINRIDNVTFQSSKMKQYESEARKLAMKEAKLKAEDYVSVLGQKVGRALTISDNSANCCLLTISGI